MGVESIRNLFAIVFSDVSTKPIGHHRCICMPCTPRDGLRTGADQLALILVERKTPFGVPTGTSSSVKTNKIETAVLVLAKTNVTIPTARFYFLVQTDNHLNGTEVQKAGMMPVSCQHLLVLIM